MYVQHDVQGVVVEAQRAPSWQVWSGKKLCGGQVPYAKLLHASTYMGKANDDALQCDSASRSQQAEHVS